jgi:hypothetical protein
MSRPMNPRTSHRKGVEFEREVRRLLAGIFGAHMVRRVQQTPGATAVPDVIAPGLVVECKSAKRNCMKPALAQAVREAQGRRGWPVAVCKQDRQPPTVTLRLEDFLELLREWYEVRVRAR